MPETNSFVTFDYLAEARERYTDYLKARPVFDRFIQTLLSQSIELQNEFKKLMQDRSLHTAYGEQLDVLGRIVGQGRFIPDVGSLKYFAFLGYPNGEGFVDNPTAATGKFYSLGQPLEGNAPLEDEEYRRILYAKTIDNNSNCNLDDFLVSLNYLVPPTSTAAADQHKVTEMSLQSDNVYAPLIFIELARSMSPVEQRVVIGKRFEGSARDTLLPKPAGVGLAVVTTEETYSLDFQNSEYKMNYIYEPI